ncbi:glutathione peroxidase [Planctomicrobium sp. SH661]|uniref:glutathione peroxidase n=1 Tax=Planctomicrobium sp. SH661 TaxID=3448124 RepID=UPI003F5C3B19
MKLNRPRPLVACCLALLLPLLANAAGKDVPPVLDFEMQSLGGKPVALKEYQGKVILIVNTASECGATPQYAPLQELYTKYKDKGLVVLGFPCNQFGAQEPGSAKEIQEFCTANYGVTFPMFAKIDVNGPDAAPLYQYLTSKETDPKFAGKIKWNFEKFLISRDGEIVGRFGTPIVPNNAEVVQAIEAELAK